MARRSRDPVPGQLTTFMLRSDVHAAVRALCRSSGVSMKDFVTSAVIARIQALTEQTGG